MPTILGFRASPSPRAIRVRSFRVPGTTTLLPVQADVAPLLIGAAREFDQTVERLVRGWCWGYAYRAIRGVFASVLLRPSKHSAGLAIDLNAPRHPLGRRGTFTRAQTAQCRRIAKKYGLIWGGDWRRPDEMHFELGVSRSKALQLVRKLQTPPPFRPAPTAPARDPYPTLRLGASGHSVRNVQDALVRAGNPRLKIDGVFGRQTDRLVRKFQANRRMTADGIVGPATWAALRKVPR